MKLFRLSKMTYDSARERQIGAKRWLHVTSIIFYNNCQATRRTARLMLQRRSLSAVINASHRPEINRHPKCVTSNPLAEGKIIPLVGLCRQRMSGGWTIRNEKGQKALRVVRCLWGCWRFLKDSLRESIELIPYSSSYFMIDMFHCPTFLRL